MEQWTTDGHAPQLFHHLSGLPRLGCALLRFVCSSALSCPTALLHTQIFGFSIWRGHATPGSQLLNLRYRNERCSSTTAGAGGRSAGLQTTRDPAAGGGNSQHSGSSSSGPSGARVAHVGDTVSSTPRLLSSSQSTASPLGGKTGVEGPGLSLHQRLALGAGMVVLPYLWARLGRLAARGWQGGWLGELLNVLPSIPLKFWYR
jgi:hypothetical protein